MLNLEGSHSAWVMEGNQVHSKERTKCNFLYQKPLTSIKKRYIPNQDIRILQLDKQSQAEHFSSISNQEIYKLTKLLYLHTKSHLIFSKAIKNRLIICRQIFKRIRLITSRKEVTHYCSKSK